MSLFNWYQGHVKVNQLRKLEFNVLFYGKQTRIVFDTYGSMPTKFGILILHPARIKSFNRSYITVKNKKYFCAFSVVMC